MLPKATFRQATTLSARCLTGRPRRHFPEANSGISDTPTGPFQNTVWAPLIASFKPDRWSGTLDYTTMRGTAASLPFAATLAHVFNHGTHHRGQITAALTALGQPCPELDLVYFLQNPSKP